MCGIVGVFTYNSNDGIDPLVKSLIQRHFFAETLFNSEPRGKDSTGISLLWDDKKSVVLKQPIPVSEFVVDDGLLGDDYDNPDDELAHFNWAMKKWLRNAPDTKIMQALGHVRKRTQGSEYNPHNNHPIIIKKNSKVPKGGSIGTDDDLVIGVHNGSISNDNQLFAKHKFDRLGEVDSEIIFHLLYEHKDDFSISNLLKVHDELKGAFAVMAFNPANPTKVAGLRETRPLDAVYLKEIGTLILVSEKKFVTPVLEEYERWRVREGGNVYVHTTESGDKIELNIENFPTITADTYISVPMGVFTLDLETEVNENTKAKDLVNVFTHAKPAAKTNTNTSNITPTKPQGKQTDPTTFIDTSEYAYDEENVIDAEVEDENEEENDSEEVIFDNCPYNWEERKEWALEALTKADAEGDKRLLVSRLADEDCKKLLEEYLIEVPDEESAATLIASFYDMIFPEGFAYGVNYGYEMAADEMDAVNQEEDDKEAETSKTLSELKHVIGVKEHAIKALSTENAALEKKLKETEEIKVNIEKHLSNLSPIINALLKEKGVMSEEDEIDKTKMEELRKSLIAE